MASPASSPSRSPPPSRSGFSSPPFPEAPKESLISRLFITPLTFISFLISLFLVDTHNHSLRTHSHSTPQPPPAATFTGKAKAFVHSLVFKPASPTSPSPYAYVQNPLSPEKIGMVGAEGFKIKNVDAKEGNSGEKWHLHTKQKKMMKAEMSDAFKIRKWVMVFLVLGGGVFCVVGLAMVRFLGRWLISGVGKGSLGKDS